MRPRYFLAASLRFPWESEFNTRCVAVLDDYLRFYRLEDQQGQAINGVIVERLHRGWPTIITSNVKRPQDIGDAAILDRLGCGLIVEMLGESKRRK